MEESEKRLRRLASELRDADEDEITAEHLLDAMKIGAAVATGKHKALTDDDVTPTDPHLGRKHVSTAPKSGIPGIIAAAGHGIGSVVKSAATPLGVVALFLTLGTIAFIAWLRLR